MFVEVLVVGIGALAAITGVLSAVVGYESMKKAGPILSSTPAAGAGLAFSYALGIVVDRGADYLLTHPRRRLRRRHFASNASYDRARRAIVGDPHIAAMADYARSRMRICRGWLINCLLLIAAADLLIWRFPVTNRLVLLIVATVTGVLLGSGFYVAWRTITLTGYKKLAQQAGATSQVVPSQVGSGAQSQ
jgi:hypothetical protein